MPITCLHNSRPVFPPTTGTGSSPSSSWSTRGGSSCSNAVRGPAETPHARRHSSPPAPPATGHAERLATRSTQLRTSAYILLIIGGQWIATGECQCCLHHHLHLLHHHTTSTSGLAFGLIFEPDAGAESFDEYTSTFGARLALAVALGLFGVADALCWLTTSVTRRASPRPTTRRRRPAARHARAPECMLSPSPRAAQHATPHPTRHREAPRLTAHPPRDSSARDAP